MEKTQNTVFGACRCCKANGYHLDLMKEYQFEDGRVVYSDVFIECFNLFLCTDIRLTTLICRACIKQLKDAHAFKRNVVDIENELLNALTNPNGSEAVFIDGDTTKNIKKEEVQIIKEELNVDLEYGADDDDYTDSLQDAQPREDTRLIFGEKELLARFAAGAAPPLPTRAALRTLCPEYFRRLEELEGQVILARELQDLVWEPNIKPGVRKRSPGGLAQSNGIKSGARDVQSRRAGNSALENPGPIRVIMNEKMAHVSNISTLLENSNLTAFMTKFKNGYPCFYCKKIFEKFDGLREHQTEHSKENIQKMILKKYRKGRPDSIVVYVDVTDLKCTLCLDNIANLNDLKSHLTKKHKKILYTNYTDRVIPFQMTDKHMCQVCSFNFETFGALERHMNTHYRNYVCEQCGAGFISKHRLKNHTYNLHSMREGKFPCDICKKCFPTLRRQKIHVDLVHKLSKNLKCPKCPARFAYYYVRQKHLLDVHGETPVLYKCNVCEKEFKRRYPLSIHIKKEHLNQGDFNCETCSYTCYSSNELKIHMEKRHGEKIINKNMSSAKMEASGLDGSEGSQREIK